MNETDILPDGLLEAEATELLDLLGAPTLIHLPGEKKEPLFVSTLLHGNETTGFYAIQRLLREYRDRPLPRSVSLFIGNVEAAAAEQRRLDHQPDYNRIWPGTDAGDCPEVSMMQQVVDNMRERHPFASLDVHNNTGINPHYACINRVDNQFLHLAAQFSRTVVYFIRPLGVQSMAMSYICPAVTLECGKVGQMHGVDHAISYLDACLHERTKRRHADGVREDLASRDHRDSQRAAAPLMVPLGARVINNSEMTAKETSGMIIEDMRKRLAGSK